MEYLKCGSKINVGCRSLGYRVGRFVGRLVAAVVGEFTRFRVRRCVSRFPQAALVMFRNAARGRVMSGYCTCTRRVGTGCDNKDAAFGNVLSRGSTRGRVLGGVTRRTAGCTSGRSVDGVGDVYSVFVRICRWSGVGWP